MENTAKATARPWRYENNENKGVFFNSYSIQTREHFEELEGPRVICRLPTGLGGEELANASLIVKSVNNHQALIDACCYVRKFYQENFDSMPVAFQTVDNYLEQVINQASK